MGFYLRWLQEYKNGSCEDEYIKQFLMGSTESFFPFYENNRDELEIAYKILNRNSSDFLIEHIVDLPVRNEYKSNEIPCFSTFEVGTIRVPELLEFSPEGISFKALGYKLMKPKNDTASQKYGENQAKLASLLHLAVITDSRPQLVMITPLGRYLNQYSIQDKKTIIRSLLLQDDYVKHVIQKALTDGYDYRDVLSVLSKNTALRRRQNVRKLISFELEDSIYASALRNINWEL